jgi:ABC-2 type transport system permease protein
MAFGVRWSGIAAFTATEVRVQFHEWLAIATGTLVQGVLVIFVWVLARDLLAFTLVGAMVYSAFLIGQRVLNEAAYVRIDQKVNEVYHASPLSPESYFLGMSAGILVAYLPTLLIFVLLLQIVSPIGLLAWGAIALVLLAVWALSASIGYVVSTLFRDMRAIWPWASLFTNVFGILPPVFYPLALVPEGWRSVALVVPTSSGAALATTAAGLESLPEADVLLAAVSLFLLAAGLLFFGV